jgi:hypothetical protein
VRADGDAVVAELERLLRRSARAGEGDAPPLAREVPRERDGVPLEPLDEGSRHA